MHYSCRCLFTAAPKIRPLLLTLFPSGIAKGMAKAPFSYRTYRIYSLYKSTSKNDIYHRIDVSDIDLAITVHIAFGIKPA